MRLRFTLAIIAAVVWSQIGYHFLPTAVILLGAGVLGILFTIGIEPPRRKHEQREPTAEQVAAPRAGLSR